MTTSSPSSPPSLAGDVGSFSANKNLAEQFYKERFDNVQTRRPLTNAPNGEVELSNEEIARYSRHLIMPEVALDGQKKLKQARVLTIGAGGLGAPLAMYLAAAGVGTLGIVDFDVVDESNLQRQIIHGTSDVGRPKMESARDRIKYINHNVRVEAYEEALTSENAFDIFEDFDIIVAGTDNFPTRYLVNDACVL